MIMKRKAILAIFTAALTLSLTAVPAYAMSYAHSHANGSLDIHHTDSPDHAKGLKQHHAEMHESLAYLQDFGVSYNEKEDAIYYQDQKVRYLIDDLDDNSGRSYHLGSGEIDVYTERDKDYKLTGVRIATEKEFQEQTDWEKSAETTCDYAIAAEGSTAQETDSTVQSTDTQIAQDSISKGMAIENDTAKTAVAEDSPSESSAEDEEKVKEYRKAGITQSKQGSWLWKGEEINLLMDDDGSLYQNNSSSASKNKVCVYVSRDPKGKLVKAEKVTGKEILSNYASKGE